MTKLRSFFLVLGFYREVLDGNVTLSIAVHSTEKQYSNLLRKVLVFQKTFFKAKVLRLKYWKRYKSPVNFT